MRLAARNLAFDSVVQGICRPASYKAAKQSCQRAGTSGQIYGRSCAYSAPLFAGIAQQSKRKTQVCNAESPRVNQDTETAVSCPYEHFTDIRPSECWRSQAMSEMAAITVGEIVKPSNHRTRGGIAEAFASPTSLNRHVNSEGLGRLTSEQSPPIRTLNREYGEKLLHCLESRLLLPLDRGVKTLD
ncbi:hypothetical protein PWT90_04164 [Aphanocladium album]|nr:hypothetical protein PWT90_04164 [Aphanocladium album]